MQALLGSWKEIAVYLHRGVRTTQRWEKQNDLPIHRVGNGSRGPVFAFSSEIADWLQQQAEVDQKIGRAVETKHVHATRLDRSALQRNRELRVSMLKLISVQKQKVAALAMTLKCSHVRTIKTITRPAREEQIIAA